MYGAKTNRDIVEGLRTLPREDTQVLQVAGQLDYDQVAPLQAALRQLWKSPAEKVVVDLSGCSYVDSAGLAALVGAFNRARRLGRRFALAGVSPQVRSLLRLTHLDRVFETYPSLDRALVN